MFFLKSTVFYFFILFLGSCLSASDDGLSTLGELVISQPKNLIKIALHDLNQAVDSKSFEDCGKCIEILYDAINNVFPSGATVDSSTRSYLHDIRHYLAILTDSYGESDQASAQASTLEITQKAGIQALNLLIPNLYKSTQQQVSDTSTSVFLENFFTLTQNAVNSHICHAQKNGVKLIYVPYLQLKDYTAMSRDASLAIGRILFNLVHNAVHYTSQANVRKVILKTNIINSIDNKPPYIQFIVSDTGAGISSDDLKKLFSQGFRGETKEIFSGSGTGLASCKKLVEEIGGEIAAISLGKGRGSLFWFTAPALLDNDTTTATTTPTVIERISISSSSMKILIVDDSFLARKGLKRIIKCCIDKIFDKNITDVASGEAALKEKVEEFDLVFMDEDLGSGKSGLKTTEEIRAKNIKQPIIISTSGNTDKDSVKAFLKAGINGFFPKGEKPTALSLLLRQHFNFETDILD